MWGWPDPRRPRPCSPHAPPQPVLSAHSSNASLHLDGLTLPLRCELGSQAAVCHGRASLGINSGCSGETQLGLLCLELV